MSPEREWIVYIIETGGGQLYTGITTDVERRLQEHKQGSKGAKYFSLTRPRDVVFQERHPDRSSASRREAAIKKLTRQQKLVLIETGG